MFCHVWLQLYVNVCSEGQIALTDGSLQIVTCLKVAFHTKHESATVFPFFSFLCRHLCFYLDDSGWRWSWCNDSRFYWQKLVDGYGKHPKFSQVSLSLSESRHKTNNVFLNSFISVCLHLKKNTFIWTNSCLVCTICVVVYYSIFIIQLFSETQLGPCYLGVAGTMTDRSW